MSIVPQGRPRPQLWGHARLDLGAGILQQDEQGRQNSTRLKLFCQDTAIPARSSQECGFEDQLEEQLAEQVPAERSPRK